MPVALMYPVHAGKSLGGSPARTEMVKQPGSRGGTGSGIKAVESQDIKPAQHRIIWAVHSITGKSGVADNRPEACYQISGRPLTLSAAYLCREATHWQDEPQAKILCPGHPDASW